MITFTVYGEPVAQGRPRFNRRSGNVYDPKKSKSFKDRVYQEALKYKPGTPLTEAISLQVKVFRSMPKMSKKRTQEALDGIRRPITKPDADNYVKGVKDALSKVIWKDDSQVVDLHVSKFYSDNPRVEISIKAVECGRP